MVNCKCGLPLATRTSWTSDNPRRKFRACKFFNHETGQRGCRVFDWVDEDPSDWQRDVINTLVAEKHRLAMENHLLNMRVVSTERDLRKLEEEEMKWRNVRRPNLRSTMPVEDGKSVVKFVGFCVVVSVIVSVMFVKVFC